MPYISNSWKNTTLVCGCHGDDKSNVMELHAGPTSVFYSCPKYDKENREEGECQCFNRLDVPEYEKMLSHIAKQVMESDQGGVMFNIQHYKWQKNFVEYEVLDVKDKKMTISVNNKKAGARR